VAVFSLNVLILKADSLLIWFLCLLNGFDAQKGFTAIDNNEIFKFILKKHKFDKL